MRRWCVVLGCVAVVIVSEVVLASAAAVVDEQPVTAGRQTPLAWPPCLAQGRKRRTAGSVDGSFQYAVVVDAGSTGSRVRVYGWPTPTGEARVALQASGVVEINSTKIRPGLSSHVGDLQRVTYDIHRVLSFAAKYVPGPLQHSSPVYVMATAGQSVQCLSNFCRAMLCISAAYAVVRCPSVRQSVCLSVWCLSRLCILSKQIEISSKKFHHRIATSF